MPMHPLRTYLRLTICGASLFVGTVCLQGALPQLSADDPLEFDQKTRELKATGRATLVHDRFHLEANEIRFEQDRGVVIGEGNVKLISNDFRALADDVEYATLDQRVSANNFKLGTYPSYMEGISFEATNKPDNREVRTTEATVYHGEPDWFMPNMFAYHLKGWPGGNVKAKHVVFKMGPVPVFYSPFAIVNTKKSSVQIRSDAGDQKNLGQFVRNNVYIQLTPGVHPGFLMDYYMKRGFLFGPAARYSGDGYRGGLQSGYIKDTGDKTVNILGNQIPRHRYFVDAHHMQEIDDHITLNGHFVKWSDFEATRDFRPKLFNQNQQPDTFGEASYAGSDFIVSAFTRVRTNKFQLVEQRVPEIRMDYLTSQLFDTPIYHSFFGSYTHIIERQLPRATTPHIATDKWDAYYGWHAPFALSDWATFTPVAGARINYYEFDQTPSGKLTRVISELGFDAEMRAYGEWDYTNKFWEIEGLRHMLTPFVQYRNIQYSHHGKEVFESRDFSDEGFLLEPIDLGSRRKLYPKADHHIVRVGLENKLQTRHKDYGSRDLAHVSFFQDAGVSRFENQTHSLESYVKAGLSPAYWLAFHTYSRFDSRKAKLQEVYTGTTIRDGNVWSLTFNTSHARGGIKQYGWTYRHELTARHTFDGSWYYDEKLRKLTSQKYRLKTKLGNSWWVTYEVGLKRGSTHVGDFQFNVQFDLVRY